MSQDDANRGRMYRGGEDRSHRFWLGSTPIGSTEAVEHAQKALKFFYGDDFYDCHVVHDMASGLVYLFVRMSRSLPSSKFEAAVKEAQRILDENKVPILAVFDYGEYL